MTLMLMTLLITSTLMLLSLGVLMVASLHGMPPAPKGLETINPPGSDHRFTS